MIVDSLGAWAVVVGIVLGLRALYFLIEGLLERLVYLSVGLSAILGFIGVKLVLVFLHEDVSSSIPEIPTPVSLGVILTVLLVTVVASLRRVRKHPEERAHAGSLRRLTRKNRKKAQAGTGSREPGQEGGGERPA